MELLMFGEYNTETSEDGGRRENAGLKTGIAN
jgi:hypothetical protein